MQAQGGALYLTIDTPETCQGYVVMSPTEYANVSALSGAFTFPSQDQFAAAFQAGAQLPIYVFIVAVLVTKVASFFDREPA
ncbi:hypothetical protein [Ralstonia pseudosolanacearum]|nr:hypothetical protein [Ralstonia pseudosolanacearum]